HTSSVDSRHSSGLKLYEVCDLYLDNFGEIGDASIELNGLTTKVGATSTVIGAALLQAIMVQSVQNLLDRGIKPELFSSSNTDDGEESNRILTEKYQAFVKSI
ncbi:MAG: putative phosphosugar-binding protein, partial [Algoriphagus sp.]